MISAEFWKFPSTYVFSVSVLGKCITQNTTPWLSVQLMMPSALLPKLSLALVQVASS